MSKKTKKRTKRYQGEDARSTTSSSAPVVHRYEAVQRSALGQWWFERRKMLRIGALTGGIALVVVWLLTELVKIVF